VFRLPTKMLVKTSAGVVLQQTTMSYDKFGHMLTETNKDIVLNLARTTTYKYVYSTTLPWHVEKLTIVGSRTDVPDTITTEYWAADAVCTGTGTGSEKGCRGKVKSVTNALGQITHYDAYDAHGRPTAIRDANGLLTEIRYTSRGWMTAITVDGETTEYEYDGVGLVKSTTMSDGTTIAYQYDPVHRLTGISDSLGNSAIYLLDKMGNRLSEVVNDPTGSMKSQVARVLDNLSRLKKITGAQ
jgi:YD repeat-containing protein